MLTGKYLNKYYKKYALFFIIGILALILVDIAQIFIPGFLGDIVNLLSAGGDIDGAKVTKIIIYVVIVALVMFVGRIIWRLTIFHASSKMEADIRHDMFLKAERLSQYYFHTTKVGTIMSWFTNDLETIEEYLGWGTIMLIDALFLSILVLIRMFVCEWVLSLIALVPLILIVVWGALVEKFMAMKWEQRQKAYDSLYDFAQENFTGIRVIKAFVKENQEIHAFAKVAKKNKEVNINFVRVSVIFDAVIEIIIAVIICLLLGFGGWFVWSTVTHNPIYFFKHEIILDAGKLIEFIGLFDTLVWPMIAMGQIVSMRSRAKASLKRVTKYFDAEEDVCSPKNALELKNVKGKIAFKNLWFTYPDDSVPVLKGISFDIEAGESVGVVGKIGCGKTTLMNLLMRLYNSPKNTVFIDDNDIMDCSLSSIRSSIAYVPQDNFLFSDTIEHNIAFSNENMSEDDVKKGAWFSDVDQDIVGFPHGYQTISGERGVTLSGGQKQRISIARAYSKHAPIMILDDSVSAVDVKTEENILNHITQERKGQTTIVIASRVSTVSHLDKILVLNEGTIEGFDTPANLLKTSPTYQNMVRLQQLEKEVEGGKQ